MTSVAKVECQECHKMVSNGYLSRHSKYCGLEKKPSYNKERAQEYYQNNRDRILDKYQNNKEKSKEYYINNADKIKERQKRYIESNRERLREKAPCEHCNQSVNKYYLNRHTDYCFKNPCRKQRILPTKVTDAGQKDFSFNS